MLLRWRKQVLLACISSFASVDSVGSAVMYVAWRTAVYQRTSGLSLSGELTTGCRPIGRTALRFKYVCKRDLKLTVMETESWESLALDSAGWGQEWGQGGRREKDLIAEGNE